MGDSDSQIVNGIDDAAAFFEAKAGVGGARWVRPFSAASFGPCVRERGGGISALILKKAEKHDSGRERKSDRQIQESECVLSERERDCARLSVSERMSRLRRSVCVCVCEREREKGCISKWRSK